MKLVIGSDGSDDGFAGLEIVARLFPPTEREQRTVTLVLGGWPIHVSTLWDKAFQRQGVVDDLHRAMAEVASIEFQRLREVFQAVGKVETKYLEGDLAAEFVSLLRSIEPDLIVVGTSRQAHLETLGAFLRQALRETRYPFITAHGPVPGAG